MGNERGRLRFGSAHAIALLALFVALFGTAYAATKINGKNIKNNSIAGKKLKPNTVTGPKVNEATLAGVNAAKLGGLTSAAFQPNGAVVGGLGDPTAISQTILTVPGFFSLETDTVASEEEDVVLRSLGAQAVTVVFGNGVSDFDGVSGTFGLGAGTTEFGGETAALEVLVIGTNKASVINCYFPDTGFGADYCHATTANI